MAEKMITVNGARESNMQNYYEEQENLTKMMFAQTARVPELKPLTQIKPCTEELDCGHKCFGCKGE